MTTFDFLLATASNLVATVLGILVGVPAAMHVNVRASMLARRKALAENATRVHASICLVHEACQYNRKVLGNIRDAAVAGKILRNPDLRLNAWDMAAPSLLSGGVSPEVLQIAAHHWTRLQRLDLLNTEMYRREVFSEYPWPDEETMFASWADFYQLICAMIDFSDEISQRLLSEGHSQVARDEK